MCVRVCVDSSEGQVRTIEPTMGGEDFAFIAQEVRSDDLAHTLLSLLPHPPAPLSLSHTLPPTHPPSHTHTHTPTPNPS